MTVGLVLEYQRSDAAFIALQLARHLEHAGHDIQILPSGDFAPLHPYWDAKVRRDNPDYANWLSDVDFVVYFDVPSRHLLDAARSLDKNVYLVCLWLSLREQDLDNLHLFTRVICPAKTCYKHLKQCGQKYKNLVCVPWDLCSPFLRSEHKVDPARIGLYWNLDGTQPLFQNSAFCETVKSLLKLPFVYVTASCTGRLKGDSLQFLRQMVADSDGRMELLKNPPWERQMLALAAHDLALWPNFVEDLGLPGLMAMTSGTPCVAYDHPVISEIIKDGVNGVLVPCDLAFNWFGVPGAAPKKEAFLNHTVTLLREPARIAQLRDKVHYKLDNRREIFEVAISNLFSY